MATARRRNRLRSKGLVADPSTALDLSAYQPTVTLKAKSRGKALWDQFVAETPFWWNEADIPMASVLCATTNLLAGHMAPSSKTSAAGQAAIIKEWRSLADALGMSPQARSRLKLTEAQSSIAAKKVEAIEAERGRRRSAAIGIDELVGDD